MAGMQEFDFAGNGLDITPEFPVADLAAAQQWFEKALAFQCVWIWQQSFSAMQCGGAQLYLRLVSESIAPLRCYLHVANADQVYQRCRQHGVRIVEPLQSTPWGMREFSVQTPDGHILRIGHGERGVAELEGFTA